MQYLNYIITPDTKQITPVRAKKVKDNANHLACV